MSTAINDVMQAASKNPELLAALKAATTPAERAKVLTDAGITPPSHDAVNAHLDGSVDDSLAGASGGIGTGTAIVAGAAAG
jgi:hypothetical protein